MLTELPEKYAISPEELQFYEDNGYLVIKGLIDFVSLYNYKQRFIQVCKGLVDRGSMTVVKEPSLAAKGVKGEDLINKVQDIHYDDVFSTYTEHPRLLHAISQLLGPELRVVHSMFINKPAGSAPHPPHQDLFYFPFRPAELVLGAWTAVDHATPENGCLYVLPRSHRAALHAHGAPPGGNKLYHGVLDAAAHEGARVQLEMSPGDTVLFHPLLVHGSGANSSASSRKCVTAHYCSARCRVEDVRGSVQDALVREVEAEAERRGLRLSFREMWEFKAKPIAKL